MIVAQGERLRTPNEWRVNELIQARGHRPRPRDRRAIGGDDGWGALRRKRARTREHVLLHGPVCASDRIKQTGLMSAGKPEIEVIVG